MRRLPAFFFIFILLGLSLGCSYKGRAIRTPVPTLLVSATPEPGTLAPGLTEAAPETPFLSEQMPTSSPTSGLPTETPTITLTPTRTRRPRTPTMTFTPSATFTLDPSNVILRIAAPGPMSKLVSPINFVVYIAPDYTGLTRIELIGEDGRELYRKVFRTYSNVGYTTRVDEQINFEIHGAAEVARLQISTLDEYNRLQSYNSVRVLLMAVGENELSPAFPLQEYLVLRRPRKGDEVSGGELTVRGEYQPLNDTPVVMELFDIDGNIIGSRVLYFNHADGSYQVFETTIPYKVEKKMPARLVIRQGDDRIAGMAYLYSIRLWVNP
jgi:hypothetical protein